MANVFERLKEMISEQLRIKKDDIKLETEIVKGLKADSLDLVEMLMNIEAEWGFEVDDCEVPGLVTVGDVVKLIKAKTE